MSDSDETTSLNSDHNDHFYDPEHIYDSPPSSSTTAAIPSTSAAAIAALIKSNKSAHTAVSPRITKATPSLQAPFSSPQITLCLHFRLGVPLQRSRSRKHIPAPVYLPFSLSPRPTFPAFMSLLRSHVDTVPRCHWPSDSSPYLQPAHSCSQWRYLELAPETFVGKIDRAWRTESKRVVIGGKGERPAAHVYVYLVEEGEEEEGGVVGPVGGDGAHGVEDTPVAPGGDERKDHDVEEEEDAEERARELEERARELEERAREQEARAREQEERAREQEDRAQQQGVKRRAEASNYGEGSSSSFFSSAARPGSGSASGLGFLSFSSAKRVVTSSTMQSPIRPRQLDSSPSRHARYYEDERHDGVEEKEEEEEEEEEEEFRTIRLRVNGTVVNYEIELRSLREALGLALLGDGSSKRRRT